MDQIHVTLPDGSVKDFPKGTTPVEIANCAPYLDRELAGLKNVRVVVCLGRIAFDGYLNYLKRRGLLSSKNGYRFAHGAHYQLPDGKILLASYHPSQQNTQTGKLTAKMFEKIFQQAAKLAKNEPRIHTDGQG